GYNRLRQVQDEAARARGLLPSQLSLAGTQALVNEFRPALLLSDDPTRQVLRRALLLAVGSREVGDRPGRREPRQVKRRPKDQKLLTEARAQVRARLMAGEEEAGNKRKKSKGNR